MRKYFLLILYVAGLVFTPQGLNAKPFLAACKTQSSSMAPLKITSGNCTLTNNCYNECNFYLSALNIEDEESVKSKLFYIHCPSWLQTDARFIVKTSPLRYTSFINPLFSFDLLKLIRVLRL